MEKKKILKLVNSEKKDNMILSETACSEYDNCIFNLDICCKNDAKLCTNWNGWVDICVPWDK